MLPGILATAEIILREKSFGHEDTLCQHAVKMMKKQEQEDKRFDQPKLFD